ncbi:carboxylate-amine ligase [Desulfosediminicola flagellatus]|uniref:carboxylate-amine ligase n=1 Tax=Desulfosediminicola flagellatus TaxID=2569541 RepID=UPI0010AD06D6|nr:YbdK family carboxylate-amine ligase [Desulfosediminicola flagellatus]
MQPEVNREQREKLEFNSSARYTLGVEIEFQTLDQSSLNLAPHAPQLLANAPPLLRPRLAEEFIQSILEIKTGICFSLADVEYDLQQTCSLAEELAADNSAMLYCASLHPFASISDQRLADNPRYLKIINELQLVGRQFISQGFHLHVGIPDRTTAIKVLNGLQPYLPLLLAASASSPFYQGLDTGFMSYRTKLFELLPLSGSYSYFKGWQQYEETVNSLISYGVIESVYDLWWDARINPEYGTVEIRICDLPGRFNAILGLVALMQCLVATLAETAGDFGPCDVYFMRANKWQAARHGLQGRFIDPLELLPEKVTDMKTAILHLIHRVQPMSIRLGCENYLEKIRRILVDDTTAVHQRQLYQQSRDFQEMIRKLNREFWL